MCGSMLDRYWITDAVRNTQVAGKGWMSKAHVRPLLPATGGELGNFVWAIYVALWGVGVAVWD